MEKNHRPRPLNGRNTQSCDPRILGIHRLQDAGCKIVRVAVPDREAGENLGAIKKANSIPWAADIHFDYRPALLALAQEGDGLRLNPGNIGIAAGKDGDFSFEKERLSET